MSSTSTDVALDKSWAIRGETTARLETKKQGNGGKEIRDSTHHLGQNLLSELISEEASEVP
jgi:hypothetical protein